VACRRATRQSGRERKMASAKTNSAKRRGVIQTIDKPTVDLEGLRKAVQEEYALVAREPEHAKPPATKSGSEHSPRSPARSRREPPGHRGLRD